MRKTILFLFSILLVATSFGQGIEFEKGDWASVLEKAKANNKPIFIDVYTTWCGPCKRMSKDIFPTKEVGDFFNKNFVCYKLDAEKGEGKVLAQKYKVMSYPNYLFINSDGELFFRSGGSMPATNFIAEGNKALESLKTFVPMQQWTEKYETNKNDTAFLLSYINSLVKLDMPVDAVFDQYLKVLPADQKHSDKVADMYIDIFVKNRKGMDLNSYTYKNLLSDKKRFMPKLNSSLINNIIKVYEPDTYKDMVKDSAELADYIQNDSTVLSSLKMSALKQTEISANKNNDLALIQQVAKVAEELSQNNNNWLLTGVTPEEIMMEFYKNNPNKEKIFAYQVEFCENRLMPLNKSELKKQDSIFLSTTIEKYSKQYDAENMKMIKQQLLNLQKHKIAAKKLNEAAWYTFENKKEETLPKALKWIDKSIELSPDNSAAYDTKANILYKLGKKTEAIKVQEQAVSLSKDSNPEYVKSLEETLEKMKNNQPI